MKKVLVVAVHPDDETLGCGGTLIKHRSQGDKIYWLILTKVTEEVGYDKGFQFKRKEQIDQVSFLYGFTKTYQLDFLSTKLDEYNTRDLVTAVSSIFKEIEPNIVYLPFSNDVHSDHRVAFDVCFSCTKAFRTPSIERILMMETLSETEFAPSIPGLTFTPNVYVDITDFFEKKLEIMRLYESEMGVHPFPRSVENIRAQALYRGASANCQYSESFTLLKELK